MTVHSDGVSPNSYQRRIGTRFPIAVEVSWGLAKTGRFQRTPKLWTATTDNVSISGVGFSTTTQKDIRRGLPVQLRYGDVTCVAMVRVARPEDTPEKTYYGLEFRDQPMVDAIEALIEEYTAEQRAAEKSSGQS